MNNLLKRTALILAFLAVWAPTLRSQTSLFNIPTTDVAALKSAYLEADFETHFNRDQFDRFPSYGFLGVYGIRKNVEVGLNGYFVRSGGRNLPLELQPTAKWQVCENERSGVAAATGAIFYLPVSKQVGNDATAMVYGVGSKKFKGKLGLRLIGGGYRLIGRTDGEDRYGALIGIEQPITRRLAFISDWNTGKNRFGYASAGFGITLSDKSSLYAAYYFGNQGRGNNSLGIYYGYSF